jgi:polysaccharide biosynthesis protein PslG
MENSSLKNNHLRKEIIITVVISFFIFVLVLIIPRINFTGDVVQSIDNNSYWNLTKGVCLNWNHYSDMQGIKDLNIQMVRDDVLWGDVETIKGVYDFSYYDTKTNQLLAQGIEPLYLIDYSNCLYNNMPSNQGYDCWLYVPRNAAKFELFKKAYGNYTYEVVKHFKGKVRYFELWNEPNNFWQPNLGDGLQISQYIELLKEGYARAKEANPQAIILSGGVATSDYENLTEKYILNYYKQGAKNYFDILAIHPYCSYEQTYPLENQGKTCDAIENIARVKEIMDNYNDSNKKIWITEWGYPTGGCYSWDGYCEPSLNEENQNIRMINIFPTLRENYPYVTGFFWYDYMDDCESGNPLDTECRFGLVRSDLSKKSAYYTYQNLSSSPAVNSFNSTLNQTVKNSTSNQTNNLTSNPVNNNSSISITSTKSNSGSSYSSSGGSSGSAVTTKPNNVDNNSSNKSNGITASSIQEQNNNDNGDSTTGIASIASSSSVQQTVNQNPAVNLIVGPVESGCCISETCYPSGYIKSGQYCDKLSKEFINQKEANQICSNSFECLSNNCISNKCGSESFIEKIIRNIKSLF